MRLTSSPLDGERVFVVGSFHRTGVRCAYQEDPVVAISPASSYPARMTPLAARRLLAALVLAAVIGALAMAAVAGAHRARSGTVSLDGAGPSVGARAQVELSIRPVVSGVRIVQPGDTLWTIARSFQPEGDVRPLVARLAKAQGGAPLQPGQRVVLPA
jgi:nucleoid-associated protein YgaU